MSNTITITKDQLNKVMHSWATDHREGRCMTDQEVSELPVDEVASQGTDLVWDRLTALVTEEQTNG